MGRTRHQAQGSYQPDQGRTPGPPSRASEAMSVSFPGISSRRPRTTAAGSPREGGGDAHTPSG